MIGNPAEPRVTWNHRLPPKLRRPPSSIPLSIPSTSMPGCAGSGHGGDGGLRASQPPRLVAEAPETHQGAPPQPAPFPECRIQQTVH